MGSSQPGVSYNAAPPPASYQAQANVTVSDENTSKPILQKEKHVSFVPATESSTDAMSCNYVRLCCPMDHDPSVAELFSQVEANNVTLGSTAEELAVADQDDSSEIAGGLPVTGVDINNLQEDAVSASCVPMAEPTLSIHTNDNDSMHTVSLCLMSISALPLPPSMVD